MIKYKLTGKVVEVSGINTVGEKDTKKQTMIFKEDDSEPDEFTGRSVPGGYWQFDVIGDDVTRLQLSEELEKKRAICSVIIRSDAVLKKDSTTDYIYPVNVNLVRVQLIKEKEGPF
jgi:hypothetical protein